MNKVDPSIKCVKCGLKGRHANIPEGWVKVVSGAVFRGDKFCDLCTYEFTFVEEEDIRCMKAEEFDCLIRSIKFIPKFCDESKEELSVRYDAHRELMSGLPS